MSTGLSGMGMRWDLSEPRRGTLGTEKSTRVVGRLIGSSGHFVKLLGQSVNVSLESVKFVISPYGVNVHGFLVG